MITCLVIFVILLAYALGICVLSKAIYYIKFIII